MSIGSALAVYFIIWWVVLFAVLPLGVRNAGEVGESVAEGHDPGAPANPQLAKKALITTLVAAVIFGLFYWAAHSDLYRFIDVK